MADVQGKHVVNRIYDQIIVDDNSMFICEELLCLHIA